MNEERWHKIKTIFQEAIELPDSSRKTYLDETCRDDNELRSKVEELIAADLTEDNPVDQTPELISKQEKGNSASVPEIIGPYKVEGLLGQGGMGSVYKAYNLDNPERPLAVKVVWGSPINASFASRFKTEWEVLSKMDHPNIAKLYGEVMIDGNDTFFAMEFVNGVEITDYCADRGLDLESRLELFLQTCRAVKHAHENRIIHRDIKPGNILVSAEGKVKLLDFGIAKVLDPDLLENTVHLTSTGVRVLTTSYASPEQLKREEITTSSDIYSLGVLLFEILSGKRPHESQGKSPAEFERIVCTEDAPLLSVAAAELADAAKGDLDVIVSKALRKDTRSRYESVHDFEKDLERYLRGEKVLAKPISKSNRAQKFFSRKKIEFASLLAAIFFLIAVGLIATRPDGTPEKSIVAENSSPKVLLALPFGHDGPQEFNYLSIGISSAVLENLSGLEGLKTITYSESNVVAKAAVTPKDKGEIFEADFVLHGNIQYDDTPDLEQKFRLSSELIRVADSLVLWSNYFDESVSEVFDVENTVALQVAESLNLVLLESDQLDQARFMTNDLEAYKYFLRGNEFFRNQEDEKSLGLAELMYKQAVERDETFSKAHAQLSLVHSRYHFYRFDRGKERCEQSEESAQQSLIHNPSDEINYLALAMHAYHCEYNFPEALNYFDQALRINPNFGEAIQGKAYVLRRSGKLQEALEYFVRMENVDPLRTDYGAITYTNMLVGNYAAAERALNIANKYFPEEALINGIGAMLYLAWTGSAEEARGALNRHERPLTGNDWNGIISFNIDMFDRDYERALINLSQQGKSLYNTQTYYIPASHLKARAMRELGRTEEARSEDEKARQHLEQYVLENPEDDRGHATLGLVYAGLGMNEKAIQSGLRSLSLTNDDLVQTPIRHDDMAYIYVQVGMFEEAINQLNEILLRPNLVSRKIIENDPRWDNLRDKPGYRGLRAG